MKLRFPAADCGVGNRCAEQSVQVRCLSLSEAVAGDFFRPALEPEPGGRFGADAQRPICGDVRVRLCWVGREIHNIRQRVIEIRGAERGR